VGRRHLIRSGAIVAASAGAAIRWKTVSDGAAPGPAVPAATGYVALSQAAAQGELANRLSPPAKARLGKIDFSKNALIAIFGEFGCQDSLVAVTSVIQHGRTLAVGLTHEQPPPGTAQCMAIFATYRLLTVPSASLVKPYPTRVTVTVAPA
jgi:hypothetical protein